MTLNMRKSTALAIFCSTVIIFLAVDVEVVPALLDMMNNLPAYAGPLKATMIFARAMSIALMLLSGSLVIYRLFVQTDGVKEETDA